jgi:hypothetical protein
MTPFGARASGIAGAALAVAFGGCAPPSPSSETSARTSTRIVRADRKQALAVAKEFMVTYLGKDAPGYFPEHNELALQEARFDHQKRLWNVIFSGSLPCVAFIVELDETATRGAMSHLQGGPVLQLGDRSNRGVPSTLRTLPEFRAAVKSSKLKETAARAKAPASTP